MDRKVKVISYRGRNDFQGRLISIISNSYGVIYTIIADDGEYVTIHPGDTLEVWDNESNLTNTPHFTKLRERFPILTDDEIVAAALNFYEMHTSDREG